MADVRVSLDWSCAGFDACILENQHLRVTVLPGLGAKIHEFVYKPMDRDLLFHHPRVELRQPVFGANVDNWWTGGIDECIPTGLPCTVDGEDLPYLGEVWSMPWTLEQEDAGRVRLERSGVITPFHLQRWLELREDEPFLRSRHRITNTGSSPIRFLWGLHAGLPLAVGTTIEIPACDFILEEGSPKGYFGDPGMQQAWPPIGIGPIEEQASGTWSLHYAARLTSGWFAVRAGDWPGGFGMTFPHDTLSSVWLWLVDGGWRGLRCLAIEPWTGYPGALDEAIRRDHARRLDPGKSITTDIRLIAFRTRRPVGGFDEDGRAVGKEMAR